MEPILDIRKIVELLPHRYPFLLVDRVLTIDRPADPKSRVGTKLVALKNVTINEPFFQGHFPGLPVMPGVLQIEAMAQAACLSFIRPGDPPMVFFLTTVQDAKFRRMVVPGDTMMIHCEIVRDRGNMLMVQCEAKVDGQTVSEASMLAKVSLKQD